MRRFHLLALLFVVMSLASGIVFWRQADWWYYVVTDHDRWPKFKSPAWEQFVVSSLVGVFFGGIMVGIGWLFFWFSDLWRNRRGP